MQSDFLALASRTPCRTLTNASYRLRVLGPVTIRSGDDPVASSRITQPRHLALLCYLALAHPRGLQPREKLIAMLWPDHDPTQGRHALRNAMHGVRRCLGEATIVSTGDQLVGLNPELVSCDAADLERGVPWTDADPGDENVEPIQGLYVSRAPEFEHWLSKERERLTTLLRRGTVASPAASRPRAPSPRPFSPDAWVMHARGHYLFLRSMHGGSPEDLLRCREYFERALELDPAFAPALAGLSNFYGVAARRSVLTPFHETFGRAIELSEQILALDPSLAVPHVHFGVKALYLDDDFERAGVELETAVRKDPSYAEAHRLVGVWLGMAGRHAEALEAMEHAVALEPDVPQFLSSLAAARLAVGDRGGAEEALRRTLRYDSTHRLARARLLRLLEDERRYEAALDERERTPALPDAARYRQALDESPEAYERLLRETLWNEAEALEERLLDGAPASVDDLFLPPVVRLVQLYLRLGERQRAHRWTLEAKCRRPGLAPWFTAIVEATLPAPR